MIEEVEVTWIDWEDDKPEKEGWYITAWSDGTIEHFYIDDEMLSELYVTVATSVLTHWSPTKIKPPTEETR